MPNSYVGGFRDPHPKQNDDQSRSSCTIAGSSLLVFCVGIAPAQTQKCYFGECGPKAAGRQSAPTQIPWTGNPYSDRLAQLSPEQQAATLAAHIGNWCTGTQPFFMGVTKEGRAAGYAYWSLTCVGRSSYLIQISPTGQGAAADCAVLKAQGQGRECYRKR